jgi:hypothetical protein
VNIASSTVFYSTDCAGSVVGKCHTQTTLDIRSFGAFSINILNAERLPVPTIRLRAVVLIRGTLMMHGASSPCMHGAFSLQGIFCFPMPLSSSVTSRPSCQATPSSETGDIIIFREPRPRTQTEWTDHGQLSFVLSLTLELFLVLFNPAHDVAFQGRAKSLFFPVKHVSRFAKRNSKKLPPTKYVLPSSGKPSWLSGLVVFSPYFSLFEVYELWVGHCKRALLCHNEVLSRFGLWTLFRATDGDKTTREGGVCQTNVKLHGGYYDKVLYAAAVRPWCITLNGAALKGGEISEVTFTILSNSS